MGKRSWTDEEFISAAQDSLSYAEILRKLNLKACGGNYDLVKKTIKRLNLDISHMTGKGWNVGLKFIPNKPQSLSEILVKDSTFVSTSHLKERLLKEKVKEAKCECCGRIEWMGQPIALELHHINGIKDDLRLENLQILCPNCHAFTDNYRGKSKALSAQKETSDVEVG